MEQPSKPTIPVAALMQQPPSLEDDEHPCETHRPDLTPRERTALAYGERARLAYEREWQLRTEALRGTGSHYRASAENPIWARIGDLLLAQGWTSPEQYITAQFKQGMIPAMRTLVSSDSCKVYKQYTEDVVAKLVAGWVASNLTFRSACLETAATFPTYSDARIWRRVLTDLRFPLSALFRYCIADNEGFTEEARRLFDAAKQQLLTDPDGYARAWAGKIPAALLEDVAATLNVTL